MEYWKLHAEGMKTGEVEWGGDGCNGIIRGYGIDFAIGIDDGGASVIVT